MRIQGNQQYGGIPRLQVWQSDGFLSDCIWYIEVHKDRLITTRVVLYFA